MVRRSALDEIGHFDPAFYPAYYEDVDLCIRLRAVGWQVVYLPAALGLHREHGSVDARGVAYYQMIHEGRIRFAAKHLPLAEFVGRYLPADARRIATELQHLAGPTASARAGLDAYAGFVPTPPTSPASPTARQGGRAMPPSVRSPGNGEDIHPALDQETGPRALLEQIADVGRRWLVEERPFTSSAPFLAPIIVWLRTRLNDAGPRWYVRQILAQQVEFNAAVFRALTGVTRDVQATSVALPVTATGLAQHIEALVAQQADLLVRLERLEARLAALDAAPPDGR
jgi:hypothetical protein